jgi:myotubularin-related protein 1/2
MTLGRMGIDKFRQWRRTSANAQYRLCQSYPKELVVPAIISDTHLALAAGQRSSKRLPALTWIHPLTGASLCRSLLSSFL